MCTKALSGLNLKNLFRLISVGVFSLIAGACSTLPEDTENNFNLNNQQQRIKSLDTWHVKGRMGFKSDAQKGFSGYISWEQEKQQYDFSINSLLGVSYLKLKGNDEFASLTFDNKSYDSADPSHLIETLTGWDIPLLSLKDWLKGMPTDQQGANEVLNDSLSESITYDELGRIASFQHDSGWQVSYGSYRQIKQHWLPHQVTLKSATSQIKIRITQWTI